MSSSSQLDITKLYYQVKKQNDTIQTQMKNIGEVYSTDNQNIKYKIEQTEYLHNLNSKLFYLYFILIFILLLYLAMIPTNNLYLQLGGVIILGFYPFIIYLIERYLYILFVYLHSTLNGNPYMTIQ